MNWNKKGTSARRARKGFSLVELVVVILIIAILAVAVFAGGSAVINKANVSRTTSDLHNFSVALESFMNSTPKVANVDSDAAFAEFVTSINENLAADYQLTETAMESTAAGNLDTSSGGNISVNSLGHTADDTVAVYESAKTDAWGNHYYVILDCGERHGDTSSDFYITVVSAGADAKTQLAGAIGHDDIFLLVQYQDGNVSAVTYDKGNSGLQKWDTTDKKLVALTDTDAKYNMADAATTVNCPVNF